MKLTVAQQMLVNEAMIQLELPSKRVIAKFEGTAGELLAECNKVLGIKKLEVTCKCYEKGN